MGHEAIFSDCGTFRFSLTRFPPYDMFQAANRVYAWVMLNPSTADADVDDPTIRRVYGFSKGAVRIEVVNLVPLRSPYPDDLIGKSAVELTGEHEDHRDHLYYIKHAAACADVVMLAWGNPPANPEIDKIKADVVKLLLKHRNKCYALGFTKDGNPRHPLYVKGDTPIMPAESYLKWAAGYKAEHIPYL